MSGELVCAVATAFALCEQGKEGLFYNISSVLNSVVGADANHGNKGAHFWPILARAVLVVGGDANHGNR